MKTAISNLPNLSSAQSGDFLVLEILNLDRLEQVTAHINRFKSGDEEIIYLIDGRGSIHFPEAYDIKKISRVEDENLALSLIANKKKEKWPPSMQVLGQEKDKEWMKKLYKVLCNAKAEAELSPNYKALKKGFDSAFQKYNYRYPMLSKGCYFIPASIAAAISLSSHKENARRQNTRDWLSEHSSNISWGLVSMSHTHCMIGTVFKSKNVLKLVIAANVGVNIWEEIELPEPISQKSIGPGHTADKKVQTDIEDFKAGAIYTSLSYLAFTKMIERRGFFSDGDCKK